MSKEVKIDTAKKITDEELKAINAQNAEINRLLQQIGLLENQKHHLLHDYASILKNIEEFKKQLEDKYGAINIDVETGVYKEIEVKEEDKK